MTWSKEVYKGITDVLPPSQSIKIHYEAMDSKEFYRESDFNNFKAYIKNKYKSYNFSLILVSDNNAFDFLVNNHKELYPNIPTVFCGVNDLDRSILVDHPEITGIEEASSIRETVDLALRLHPNTKEIFVINDYLTTGRAWDKQFKNDLAELEKDLKITYSENVSIENLKKTISKLPENSLIFLGVYYTDKNNIYSTYEDMAKNLANSAKSPFYTLVKFNIQKDIIGGKVISGFKHGEAIGKIGLKLLEGIAPRDIPIENKEYNQYVFNYLGLKKYGIDIKQLPLDSEIINRPYSIYEEYKYIIWISITSFIILIVLIIFLVINIIKKNQIENTLRQFSESTWEGIIIHSENSILEMNKRFSEIFGYTRKELEGGNFLDKIIAPNYIEKVENILKEDKVEFFDTIGINKNGELVPVEIRTRHIDYNGIHARVEVIRDLSDQKKAEKEHKYLQNLWDTMFENSSEAIFVFNSKQEIERVNKSFIKITGYSSRETLNKVLNEFKSEYQNRELDFEIIRSISKNNMWCGELLARRKSGELFSMLLNLSILNKDSVTEKKYIGVFSDISDKKQQEKELKWMSQNDTLTGFSNRSYFLEMLKTELKKSSRSGEWCGILLLNIDGLKSINAKYGFIVGDEVIKEFSSNLKNCLRDEDIVSRFSGDEFAILAPRFTDKNQIKSVVKRIIKNTTQTIKIDGNSIEFSVSIGVSIFPFDGLEMDDLLSKSSTALKRAKSNKKGSFSFYNSELDKTEIMNLELELDLKRALALEEIDVFYQPKVNPNNSKIEGFEALVRWNRRKQEWISPQVFIPITEENGLIIEIGYFVLSKACDFVIELKRRGYNQFHVGVNISAKQFSDPKFIDNLINIVNSKGIDPKFIDLEITESITASKIFNTIESLSRLSDYGFSISIDDFGTGYSSLQYLISLPFNTMKIDKSFVDSLLIEGSNLTILNTMISLAHSLGKKIVAEGAETESQVEYLLNAKCQLIQGYYYYRPMPKDQLLGIIDREKLL